MKSELSDSLYDAISDRVDQGHSIKLARRIITNSNLAKSTEDVAAMAREITRLREANERLHQKLEDKENCACWVEYDYRCPVHGEQSE